MDDCAATIPASYSHLVSTSRERWRWGERGGERGFLSPLSKRELYTLKLKTAEWCALLLRECMIDYKYDKDQ